ncbi:MAG: teichoic acid transport system ATP-binding protein [Candidatus Aldehydirespiratoraceae bacterium]|jgi:teichoic acid transport system ATP-binding protein
MGIALDCRDVHVEYLVRGHRRGIRDTLRGAAQKGRLIHAVRGVSLQVKQGESVGIIGPNGSGKSTLLRTMAGLLPTTRGEVLVHSMPALLGVNAVLRPRMTGRRNIMIGLLAQGVSLADAAEKAPAIIDFAELDEFIDLPMETYSSGMRARLHFAIATAVTPDILLIDEALAVGDRWFRERSAQRLDSHREGAGTIVLVSHNLSEIRRSCEKVVWLEKGVIVQHGPVEEVLTAYESA